MAGALPLPPEDKDKHRTTILYDADGREVLRIGIHDETTTDTTGREVQHLRYETIELVDGTSWNPQMLYSKDPVNIVACYFCRSPGLFKKASHGLCSAANAARCTRCNRFCCPRHARKSADGQVLCPSCSPLAGAGRFLRNLFMDQ